jgi:hypothetical protein
VAVDDGELAEEPAGEVDEVDALVDQLAAAGERGVGAPLAVVAAAAAVAVAAAQEHQRAERAGVEELAGFLRAGVEAVIVAEADADARRGRRLDGAELGGVERAGLLDEHVFAGAHGASVRGRARR